MKVTNTEFKKIWNATFAMSGHVKHLENETKDFFATVNEINRISNVRNRFLNTDEGSFQIGEYEIATNWKELVLPYKVCAYASEYSLDLRSKEYYNVDKADKFGKVMDPYTFKSFQNALFSAMRVNVEGFMGVSDLRTVMTVEELRGRIAVYKPTNVFSQLVSTLIEPAHCGEFKVRNTDDVIWPIVSGVLFEEEAQFSLDGHQMMLKYMNKVFNG